jgi:hypothetical protein
MDDRRLTSLATELGLSAEELVALRGEITPGLDDVVLGGLIRFEDALFELSQ